MSPWLLQHLVCPRDRGALTGRGDRLVCPAGHEFPVVQGVPVLLVPDVEQTLWVAQRSVERSRDRTGSGDDDPFFTDTLGLTDEQRRDVRERMNRLGQEPIDPVANALVVATSGNLYHEVRGRLGTYPIPELRLAGGGGTFLDVGCNWGRWCVAAARKGYQVVGIDPSLGAVLAAQRVTRRLGLDCTFVVADARYLPFAPASFDVVFSYSVLQHLSKSDAAAALGEVARVLVPGGCSLIQMANAFGVRSLYHQVRRGFREPTGFDVRYWRPKELVRRFREIIGPTEMSVDCYFGLGVQASDAPLLPRKRRAVIRSSEFLRALSRRVAPLRVVADSLYLKSVRRPPAAAGPAPAAGANGVRHE